MRILFVCTGNTFRSPIAEAIFNEHNKDEDIIARSAGISTVPGSKTNNYLANILDDKLNKNINDREAIQVKNQLLRGADIILTMSSYGRDYVKEYYSECENKVFTLSEYVGKNEEILDPYGGPRVLYEKTYKQIDELVNLLLLKIKEDKSK